MRNLAKRSAEAAKDTTELISGALQDAEQGVHINEEVMSQLEELDAGVRRVQGVMGEIAEASAQQQRGVDEINSAVEQMNELTQSIAASAEENASSAEELRTQTRRVEGLVGEFQLAGDRGGSDRFAAGRGLARSDDPVARVAESDGWMEAPSRVAEPIGS